MLVDEFPTIPLMGLELTTTTGADGSLVESIAPGFCAARELKNMICFFVDAANAAWRAMVDAGIPRNGVLWRLPRLQLVEHYTPISLQLVNPALFCLEHFRLRQLLNHIKNQRCFPIKVSHGLQFWRFMLASAQSTTVSYAPVVTIPATPNVRLSAWRDNDVDPLYRRAGSVRALQPFGLLHTVIIAFGLNPRQYKTLRLERGTPS